MTPVYYFLFVLIGYVTSTILPLNVYNVDCMWYDTLFGMRQIFSQAIKFSYTSITLLISMTFSDFTHDIELPFIWNHDNHIPTMCMTPFVHTLNRAFFFTFYQQIYFFRHLLLAQNEICLTFYTLAFLAEKLVWYYCYKVFNHVA